MRRRSKTTRRLSTATARAWSAAAAIAPIFNWATRLRYDTDTGRPSFALDSQPPYPPAWRALSTGPLPHLASPGWSAKAAARLQLAYDSSPAARAAAMRCPVLLIQGDADEEGYSDENCVASSGCEGCPPVSVT